MKRLTFHNSITILASAAEVYAYLINPMHLPDLHPLIIGVNPLPSERPGSKRVEIQDKIMLFGRLPFYKKYEASFTPVEENRKLILETFTSPGIHITNTIVLEELGNETLVEERVSIEVSALLAKFVMKQIEFSHVEMLHALKKKLELA
ncbi:SRPBCC family protein [Paenibacillus roseipurpureus]|uniref:SRPBCC family protein n=1 Tax=Paenibacillus roseopurpureus TaxID=2918901 RepID=A0AA96RK86_9BACL|nr:SRPBCC family protein [Paenibacillus sp. MBLB1832]WNR44031.1 SRPBCC family protein [Paenibacillus sp. MBLB1832]